MTLHYLWFCLFVITTYFLSSIDANEAIVGGLNAGEGQFPYQVSIFFEGKGHECGGAIISDKHILTAAHCFIKVNGEFHPYRIFVLAGTNNLRKTNEPAVTIEVERIFVPKVYSSFVRSNDGDIAVLELSASLELKKNKRYMRKAKIPKNKQDTYSGRTAMISGFGWNRIRIDDDEKYGNNSDGYLRFVEADVLYHTDCHELYSTINVSDKEMCARVKQTDHNQHGVCTGDSGSPLVVDDSVIIGILSRSPGTCEEKIKSGMYTRVSHYLSFIGNALKGRIKRNIRVHGSPNQ